jgi:hypothetical protein
MSGAQHASCTSSGERGGEAVHVHLVVSSPSGSRKTWWRGRRGTSRSCPRSTGSTAAPGRRSRRRRARSAAGSPHDVGAALAVQVIQQGRCSRKRLARRGGEAVLRRLAVLPLQAGEVHDRPSTRGGVPVLKRATSRPSASSCSARWTEGASPARPAATPPRGPTWMRPRRKVPAVSTTASAAELGPVPVTTPSDPAALEQRPDHRLEEVEGGCAPAPRARRAGRARGRTAPGAPRPRAPWSGSASGTGCASGRWPAHDPAERVHLPHHGALGHAPDGGVAAHLADRGRGPGSRGGCAPDPGERARGGFDPRMSAPPPPTPYRSYSPRAFIAPAPRPSAPSGRVIPHFPMQKSPEEMVQDLLPPHDPRAPGAPLGLLAGAPRRTPRKPLSK